MKEQTQCPVPVKWEAAPVLADVAESAVFSASNSVPLLWQSGSSRRILRPAALFFHVTRAAAAIASAYNSDFGWGGLVFTKEIARVNNEDLTDVHLLFCGVKTSRHGHKLGHVQYSAICQQNAGESFAGRDEIAGGRP